MPFFSWGLTLKMAQRQHLHPLITRVFSYAIRAGHHWLGLRKLYTGQPTATATEIMFPPPDLHVCFRYIERPTIELTILAEHSDPRLCHGPGEGSKFE